MAQMLVREHRLQRTVREAIGGLSLVIRGAWRNGFLGEGSGKSLGVTNGLEEGSSSCQLAAHGTHQAGV